MNSFSLSSFIHFPAFISGSIFLGLEFLIPLLFILEFFNVSLKQLKLSTVIISANVLLLIGGTLFLCVMTTNISMSLYHGNDFEKDFLVNAITGPHWFQFVIPVLNFALLPHLMWFKKFRSTTTVSLLLVAWWIVSNYYINYLSKKESVIHSAHDLHTGFFTIEYVEKAIIFIALLTITFTIFNGRKNNYFNN
jgi:hypothetical protein